VDPQQIQYQVQNRQRAEVHLSVLCTLTI
jgi:hypothetical protein